MKRKYFGTDGVRGRVGGEWINPEFARRLGFAAGAYLRARTEAAPLVVVGRDTRYSGPEIENALVQGLTESGADVLRTGVAPTPAVAMAVLHFRAGLGAVITASHNPAHDNGIKFFSASGAKLRDQDEIEIESIIDASDRGERAGRAGSQKEAAENGAFYVDKLAGLLPADGLAGWNIVLDTANGAGYRTAPAVLRRLGARLVTLGDAPDGYNINDGVGSQHPERMGERVREEGAAIGIALDGDGDRIVLSDETGTVLDGDEVLAILALSALRRGALAHDTLVVTKQSNLGLDEAIRNAGGRVERTDIGDRYVAERMIAGGFNLGGESSGHILFTDISPAGDGLLAALKVIEVMRETPGAQGLSALRSWLRRYPQRSESLTVRAKPDWATLVHLSAIIREAERAMGKEGRVLARFSGTEPKLRLLVESREAAQVSEWMDKLREAAGRDGLL